MNVSISEFTNVGTREINEDAFQSKQNGNSFVAVVCDGLGGHDKGEVASDVVSKSIVNMIEINGKVTAEKMADAISTAQENLMQVQKAEKAINAMKTTGVLLWSDGENAMFGHVGDTRGYCFKKFFGYTRTIDHSVPQVLASSGQIKDRDIRFHPDRNNLLRVFGIPWDREMYTVSDPFALKKGMSFLLCTDGFWEWIDEKTMRKCLRKSKTPAKWINMMQEEILKKAGSQEMDNYTAIAVFVR